MSVYKNIHFSIGNTNFKIIFYGKYGHTSDSWYAPYHLHPFSELHLMYSGSVRVKSENNYYTVEEGNLCLLPSGVFHAIEQVSDIVEKTSVFVEIKKSKNKTSDTYSIFSKLFLSQSPLIFDFSPVYQAEITKVLNSSSEINAILTSKIQSLFTLIFTDLYEKTLIPSPQDELIAETDYKSNILLKIEDYINKTDLNFITEESMAKSLFITTSQLRRLLKKHFRSTFRSFIKAQKIEIAKNYISKDNLTMHEIAKDLGYDTYSGFYRSFKSVTGVTPEEYKKEKKL